MALRAPEIGRYPALPTTDEAPLMLDEIRHILTEVLHLGERGKSLDADSPLLGSIPEFDSMAVVSVITVIEEHYGIEFDDDDLTADSFATLGSLCSVVEGKFASQ